MITPIPSALMTHYIDEIRGAINLDDAPQVAALLTDPRAQAWSVLPREGQDGKLLGYAASVGAEKVVRLLMPLSNLNHQDNDGYTPLMRAIKARHVAVLRELLRAVANPERVGGPLDLLHEEPENHRNALHLAAYEGDAQAVSVLLPHIPATTLSTRGTLALHDAAEDGTVGTLDLLLPFEGVDHQDLAGWTPIMYAVINGRHEAVARLAPLSNLSLRNEDQDLALDLARRRGVDVNVQVLRTEMQRQEAAALRKTIADTAPVLPRVPRIRL